VSIVANVPITGVEGHYRLLHHLPEWCVYILCPTPRPVLGALSTLYGY